MYKRFHFGYDRIGKEALEAVSGLGFSLVTNKPERCCDRDKHADNELCIHEKDDAPCEKCKDCDPRWLLKSDVFWYANKGLDTRYKHEQAKVGDKFWDGNNGDKHVVEAVDLESSRLVFRNLSQNEELLEIAAW